MTINDVNTAGRLVRASCLSLVLLGVGCSQQAEQQRRAVAGEVTVNGQPLEYGFVRFLPVGDTHGPGASCPVRAGRFDLPQQYGPVVGAHRVEIQALDPDEPDPDDAPAVEKYVKERRRRPLRQLPARYNTASQLQERVAAEAANQFRFELVTQR